MPVVGLPNVLEDMIERALNDMTLVSWNISGKDSQIYINLKFNMDSNTDQQKDISKTNQVNYKYIRDSQVK